jgi:hypothetical protein
VIERRQHAAPATSRSLAVREAEPKNIVERRDDQSSCAPQVESDQCGLGESGQISPAGASETT